MKTLHFVLVSLAFIASSAMADIVPNAKLTPGVARVVDKNTLCTTSTKLVRNVPSSVKKQAYTNYGLTGNHTGYCSGAGGCEVDHLISLELGGSNDIKNLWPEPFFGKCNAHQKDALENKLHAMICSGSILMPAAQKQISTNWILAYGKYVDKKGCQ